MLSSLYRGERRRRSAGVILSDRFNRANGAIGTAETGQVYTQHVGVWTVASNQAAADATASAVVSAQCSLSDVAVQADVVSGQRFVAFRVQDATNFLIAGIQNTETLLRIFTCIAGAFTEVNIPGVFDVGVTAGTVRVRATGTTIAVDFNGIQRRLETIANFQAATRHGLFGLSGVFDNLSVSPP